MKRAVSNMWGTIFNKSDQFICFAHYVDILGGMFQAVATWYTKLISDVYKVGLKVKIS